MPDLPYFLSKAQEAPSACFEKAPNFRTKAAEPPPMQPPSESQISEQGQGRWQGLASRRPAGDSHRPPKKHSSDKICIPPTAARSRLLLRVLGFPSSERKRPVPRLGHPGTLRERRLEEPLQPAASASKLAPFSRKRPFPSRSRTVLQSCLRRRMFAVDDDPSLTSVCFMFLPLP